MQKKSWLLVLILVSLSTLAGCASESAITPASSNQVGPPRSSASGLPGATYVPSKFRSDKFYLTVNVPQGWGTAEGLEGLSVLGRHNGQVSFNSWGENGFWAREIQTGNSYLYGPDEVMRQIPEGGAYVDLVWYSWPPHEGVPDYNLDDLSGLWKPHDLRQDTPTSFKRVDFFKWERHLLLGVYCSPLASDTTVAQLNDLLQSWKWDTLPAGDIG